MRIMSPRTARTPSMRRFRSPSNRPASWPPAPRGSRVLRERRPGLVARTGVPSRESCGGLSPSFASARRTPRWGAPVRSAQEGPIVRGKPRRLDSDRRSASRRRESADGLVRVLNPLRGRAHSPDHPTEDGGDHGEQDQRRDDGDGEPATEGVCCGAVSGPSSLPIPSLDARTWRRRCGSSATHARSDVAAPSPTARRPARAHARTSRPPHRPRDDRRSARSDAEPSPARKDPGAGRLYRLRLPMLQIYRLRNHGERPYGYPTSTQTHRPSGKDAPMNTKTVVTIAALATVTAVTGCAARDVDR